MIRDRADLRGAGKGIITIVTCLIAGVLGCAAERQGANKGLSSGAIFEFGPCRAAGATCGAEGRRSSDGGDAALWRGGPFRGGPYLVKLAGGRVAVSFVAATSGQPHIEWWFAKGSDEASPAPGSIKRTKAVKHDGLWVATLGPFELGRHVAYRVVLASGRDERQSKKPQRDKQQISETYRFSTGRHRGESFRFIAYGDTRTYHMVHWRVINAMAQHDADFVIHTGDLVENGGVEEEWLTFLSIVRPVAARAPMLVALGNHDVSPHGLFRRFFLFDMSLHLEGPDAEMQQRYYTRDWGNLRVILMDPELEFRSGSSQFAYMEQMIREAAERDMYIVLVSHRPPYSSGSHGSYEPMRKALAPLVARYGVELVISGHSHNYERTKEIDGATYLVTGGGGAPIHPVNPQPFTAAVRTEPHYVLIDVDKSGLALRAMNLSGEVFDSYLVKPNPPRMNLTRR